MYKYDPSSSKAEEFINHQEILDTLEYAHQNSRNETLINEILAKAALRKGLTHREASVLLVCQLEEKNREIYALAEQIKKDRNVCPPVPVKLLYQRLCLLPVSRKK